MSELLAPAGSFEALVAAISNGADAIYLGMKKFGARAYASNFDEENLTKAIKYAHLRNVKIYVTMNTIVFEEEIPDMEKMIDFLYTAGVDGIIIQDLAVLDYVTKHYPDLEAHCSTQMGIDSIEGAQLFKELGAKRVVLARETPLEKIKQIKKAVRIPLEIFIHGALCVSYSGNCLMSGLIGYRSGNRGRCVGSCRKPYQLLDLTENKTYPPSYLLSMKDLNTIDNIDQLKEIDSLKIEGRMKEPYYVANVVDSYRKALDGNHQLENKEKLYRTFQRTFTKGYIFKEDKKNITNILKPNNFGILIGKITQQKQNYYQISLTKTIHQNDMIRIDHNGTDVNLSLVKLYDKNKNFVSSASKECYIQAKETLSVGDSVYLTKDYQFYEALEKSYPKEYVRFPLTVTCYAYPNAPLSIDAVCGKNHVHYDGPILEEAQNNPTTKDQLEKQFNRLNDTIYTLHHFDFDENNAYIPAKIINDARRYIVSKMNQERLKRKKMGYQAAPSFQPIGFEEAEPQIAVFASTKEQYEAAKECLVPIIYDEEHFIKRNEADYDEKTGTLLIGGYGGIEAYKNKNQLVSDYSLNAVNSTSVYLLHQLGVKRVTLSYEINKKDIEDLLSSYYQKNHGYPNLEMIVYGRAPLMVTKYCPLKKMNQCGLCHNHEYALKDEFGIFPIQNHKDCTVTILNGKILNLIDEINQIKHIQVFRIQLTKETKEESIKIIKAFQQQLKQPSNQSLFNSLTDTRGHFKKEIL